MLFRKVENGNSKKNYIFIWMALESSSILFWYRAK